MELTQILPQLGSTGIAVLVLYMVAKEFLKIFKAQNERHAMTIETLTKRHSESMEKKDTALRIEIKEREDSFRKLEKEVRESLVKQLTSSNIIMEKVSEHLRHQHD